MLSQLLILVVTLATDGFFLLAQANRPGAPKGPPGDGCAESGTAMALSLCGCFACQMIIFLPIIAGMWKSFAKAGQPGYASIIPFYNYMVFAKIAGKEDNRWLFYLIPVAQYYFLIVDLIDFCKAFGKETGFAIGVMLLPMIFWPILGFGSAEYQGVPSPSARRRARRFEEEEEEEEERPRRPRRRREDEEDY